MTRQKHDEPYHVFYGHPDIFRIFLEGFAPPELLALIDFNTLRREDVKSSDQKLNRRVGDLLFSFHLCDGTPAWAFMLLEVQRENDALMAFRLLEYSMMFWKRAINEHRLVNGKLPALLAMVLYNGPGDWTSPQQLQDCIDLPPGSPFRAWAPNLRYALIDISKLDLQDPRTQDNPVRWLMELEASTDKVRTRTLFRQKIMPWWRQVFKANPSLHEALQVFVFYCLNSGRGSANRLNLSHRSIESEEDMLSITEKFDQWETEAREEGRQEGRHEGRQEGRQEGLRLSVKTLLVEKFGDAGIDFWQTSLEPLDIAPWQNILTQLLHVKTPQELQYKHLMPVSQDTSDAK